MAFDIKTAKPIAAGGFDIKTARPVSDISYPGQVGSEMKRILPMMLPGLRDIKTPDIISGMWPYKAGQSISAGIKEATLPAELTGIDRAVIDIATDPLSYAGGGIVPKVATKGGKILRSGMGISSDSARWVKVRGAKTIFTPEKEAVDYIKTTLSPIVQRDVEKATTGVIRKAEKMFSKAESRLKTNTITLDKTFNNAKDILDKYGFLDVQGRVLPSAFSEEVPSQLKVIAKMYEKALPATGKISGVGPMADKAYFRFYRNLLRGVQKKKEGFSTDVQNVIEGLYDDMEKAGAKGIREAKNLFRKASQFEEEFGLTPSQIESKLTSAVDPKNTESVKRLIKPILGKKTDAIFQNIKDHRVAQEFVAKGRPPWTRMGVLLGRPGKQILKSIYETKYPLPLFKKP